MRTVKTTTPRIGRPMTRDERIAVLEQDVAELRQVVADLREELEARLRPAAPERPRLTLVAGEGGEA